MNCHAAREYLAFLADGEAQREVRAEVEAHIAGCAACQNEVARWRAVRRAASRGVHGVVVPVGLRERVAARLRRASLNRYRTVRLLVGAVAAAACVSAAVVYWPSERPVRSAYAGASIARTINVESLVSVFEQCALIDRDDRFGVRGGLLQQAWQATADRAGFPVLLPDLSAHGYHLDGVCECLTDPGLRVVHAFYRGAGSSEVLSVFSVNARIALRATEHRRIVDSLRTIRTYEIDRLDDTTLLSWRTKSYSYAVCGTLPEAQLEGLAEEMRLPEDAPRRPGFAFIYLP